MTFSYCELVEAGLMKKTYCIDHFFQTEQVWLELSREPSSANGSSA